MIKTIYKTRISTLRREYSKLANILESKKKIIDEYLDVKEDVLKEIESISKNDNIEPNLKYIEIDKKIKYNQRE